MRYFLGIDGGQSSTAALVADESGRVLGKGTAGPCNHVAASEARGKFIGVIEACVGAARQQAAMPAHAAFRAACVGMSGGPADKQAILGELIPSEDMLVTDDAVIALSGAMAGNPGLIVVAGTGSIAFGKNAEGQTARAGGWGFVFGDEGGAFDIVRQSLRAALRHEEGWGSATMLQEMFLRETGEADMNAVLHAFYTPGWPRFRAARLAATVDTLAEAGDAIAARILQNAGRQLAQLSAAVKEQLWPGGKTIKAAFTGGVFSSRLVLEAFIANAENSGCDVIAPILSPAAGAVLEALKLAGLTKLLISNF